jgi:hypothetical protein
MAKFFPTVIHLQVLMLTAVALSGPSQLITGNTILTSRAIATSPAATVTATVRATPTVLTATASSVHTPYLPKLAMDGNPVTFYHSLSEHNPWFQVELNSPKLLTGIKFTNRGNCCGNRFRNVGIHFGNTPMTKTGVLSAEPECTVFAGPSSTGQVHEIKCRKPMNGKYLLVQLRNTGDQKLQIAEIELRLSDSTAAATTTTAATTTITTTTTLDAMPIATSSSMYSEALYPLEWLPKYAIDGKISMNDFKFFVSKGEGAEKFPWLQVDYQTEKSIESVLVTSRGNDNVQSKQNFKYMEVFVGNVPAVLEKKSVNSLCANNAVFPGKGLTAQFDCKQPLIGRYLVIQMLDSYNLQINEVTPLFAY